MSDPTGTTLLRRSFQAEGNRRLGRLRSATHGILVEHDLMAARNGPLAQMLPRPGDRLAAFAQWFEQTVNEQLLGGRWWEKFLERAYQSGFVAGRSLLGGVDRNVAGSALTGGSPPSPTPLPAVFRELAQREFAGIAAALVQQVSRQAAGAAIGRRKPQPIYRQVLPVLHKVGGARVRAAANTMAVKLHNAGRLEQFRAAGITLVGIDPERLELQKPSFLSALPSRERPATNPKWYPRHDHRVHIHVHDRETELERRLREVNELLQQQRSQREQVSAQAQAELAALKTKLEAEIAAHEAGAEVGETAAQAREALAKAQKQASAEVATAKATTAAGEEEAKAAWQAVLAARKEARAAEYAAKTAARAKPASKARARTAPKAAAKAVELVSVATAGDERVCDICNDLEDEGPYSLEEAQALLPAHPHCRCSVVPYEPPEEDDEDDDEE
jgi:DNA-binding transcriptional MerR regulator